MRRIGMTTDPARRKQKWEAEKRIRNWRILKSGLTYDQAQAVERRLGSSPGCEYHAGGNYVRGRVWYVYSFEY